MSSLAILYVFTAVISIGIALMLVRFAMLSGHSVSVPDKKMRSAQGRMDASASGSITKIISREISEIVDSTQRREEIASVLSHVFAREMDKNIKRSTDELRTRYDNIVKERAESEEIAWKKYKKVLTDKKATEDVIRSVAEGLVVVDSKGRVVMINPAAEKLLGVSSKEKIGKNILDNLKSEQIVSLAKPGAEEDNREIELVSRDDETKKVLRASSAVIENESGVTMGMVSVLSDITKQKELDRMKADFVASISHELRTPLLAIEKSVLLILDGTTGPVPDPQRKLLVIADRNLKRLTVLINDLLDLTKLEAKKVSLNREPANIGKVIGDSAEGLSAWARAKYLDLKVEVEDGIPDINIDAARVTHVLNNLIGNAIKFTPNNGRITVSAAMRAKEGAVEVSVEDNGIGISPEDLPKVFDKFYQAGDRVATDISGTGIGLSIAKEVVALHGGKIWAESEKDKGTKFIFTLPVKA